MIGFYGLRRLLVGLTFLPHELMTPLKISSNALLKNLPAHNKQFVKIKIKTLRSSTSKRCEGFYRCTLGIFQTKYFSAWFSYFGDFRPMINMMLLITIFSNFITLFLY